MTGRYSLKLLIFILLMIGIPACQQQHFRNSTQNIKSENSKVAAFSPQKRPFKDEYLKQLKLPEGFDVNVFAKGLINPRMMAVSNDGTVFVTEPNAGKVVALMDTGKTGKADKVFTAISGLKKVHGIAIRRNILYIATPTDVYTALIKGDKIGKLKKIINNLPQGGRHPNRTLGFAPDGKLYISVGSSCNACVEENFKYATILQANSDGSELKIFSEGIRSTLGFDWHPVTRKMWGMDQGSDWRGADIPPEELNLLAEKGNYGWPWCYGQKKIDTMMTEPPAGVSKQEYCEQTMPAVLTYQAHSSPIGFVFYKGDLFPKEYKNDAFITFRGSWNRQPPVGYKVVRVRYRNGKPTGFEDFLTGFLIENKTAQFARISGLVVAKDGSLLIADDENGIIYRISYKK